MVEASSRPTGAEPTAAAPRRHAIIVVLLTIVLCAAACLVAQPRITHWLNVRAAYRNLSHVDQYERDSAAKRLVQLGEDPNPALIDLLHGSNVELRDFAAVQLSARPPTAEIIESFLLCLETMPGIERAMTGQRAAIVLVKSAETTTGPLTAADRRIIAALRPLLTHDDNWLRSTAATGLAAYSDRDKSLRAPLTAYLRRDRSSFDKYRAARHLARRVPAFRKDFIPVLADNLISANGFFRQRALQDLHELDWAVVEVIETLNRRREVTTDSHEASRIEEAVGLLESCATR